MSEPVWIGLDVGVLDELDAFFRAQIARAEAEALAMPAEESARVTREWLGLSWELSKL